MPRQSTSLQTFSRTHEHFAPHVTRGFNLPGWSCRQAQPPLLDFDAAQHLFRPYWVPLTLAVVIMLAGMLRAVAPLDVPWLRTINIGLAAALVANVFLVRADVSQVVQINQLVVGAAIALVSLVVAIDAGRWLG